MKRKNIWYFVLPIAILLAENVDLAEISTCKSLGHCTLEGDLNPVGNCERCFCICKGARWIDQCCDSSTQIFNPIKKHCTNDQDVGGCANSTTVKPNGCEAIGTCDTAIDTFHTLGACENCYCQCAQNLWVQQCCPGGQVWNPDAWPNPNSCDDPTLMDACKSLAARSSRGTSIMNVLCIVWVVKIAM